MEHHWDLNLMKASADNSGYLTTRCAQDALRKIVAHVCNVKLTNPAVYAPLPNFSWLRMLFAGHARLSLIHFTTWTGEQSWPTKAEVLSCIPQGSMLGRWRCGLQFLLMTYWNVSKAVKKDLLMIPKYMTRHTTVLRYRKTSINYKNGLSGGIYTLMLQSVRLCA